MDVFSRLKRTLVLLAILGLALGLAYKGIVWHINQICYGQCGVIYTQQERDCRTHCAHEHYCPQDKM
jgi:hypothetical protein